MNETDVTVNARIAELEARLNDTLSRLSKTEGTVEQLNRSIASGNRMTNWQFIVFIIAIVGSLLGSMYWATGVLERRMEDNRVQLERRMEDNREQLEKRFEDLRQVVLANQKR